MGVFQPCRQEAGSRFRDPTPQPCRREATLSRRPSAVAGVSGTCECQSLRDMHLYLWRQDTVPGVYPPNLVGESRHGKPPPTRRKARSDCIPPTVQGAAPGVYPPDPVGTLKLETHLLSAHVHPLCTTKSQECYLPLATGSLARRSWRVPTQPRWDIQTRNTPPLSTSTPPLHPKKAGVLLTSGDR